MQYAGFWRRLAAGFIDFVVFLPLFALFLWVHGRSRAATLILTFPYFLSWAAYEVSFHALWGQSIGKMVVGVRVVGLSGTPISWRQAAMRFSVDIVFGFLQTLSSSIGLVRLPESDYYSLTWQDRFLRVDELSPYNGLLTWLSNLWVWSELVVLLFNKRRRALHDFIAGTVVVHVPKRAAV